MRWVLILFCSTLLGVDPIGLPKADLLKSAPTEIAFPKVDIISGTYIEDAVDLVVAGHDPLSIRRFYYHTAPTCDTRYGFWHFNPEATLTANLEFSALPLFASVGQFSGGMIQCQPLGGARYGLSNNSSPSYHGQSHPLNIKLTYDKIGNRKNDERFQWSGLVKDGSGSVREFLSNDHHWHKDNKKILLHKKKIEASLHPSTWIPYQLPVHRERRPNGNIIIYNYCAWRNEEVFPWPKLLKKITLYNASQTKELSSLTFDYVTYTWKYEQACQLGRIKDDFVDYHNEVASFTITGSDGRKAIYQHSSRSRDFQPVVLKAVHTPSESYQLDYRGYALQSLKKGSHAFRTEYDTQGRVSAQYTPAGLIAKYTYAPGMTTITDGEGHQTRYFFTTFVNRIETEESIQENSWDPKTGNLLSETLYDKQGKLYLKKLYTYDKNHNPILEKVGDGDQWRTLTRTFSDDGFNLLLSESDREGVITRYSYIPDTNLLASEICYEGQNIRKRIFHNYDDCAICIKTIIDDGSSLDPDDLTAVTYRKITRMTPKYSQPCFGLPAIIEEKTIDNQGKELLLKRVIYTYAPSGQILTEEHYDAHNQHRFTICNTYDAKERLISTTDPLGHITIFAYDENNNLTDILGPRIDQHQTISYDAANRPICMTTRQADGSLLAVKKQYNKLGQLISETDVCGNNTSYTYDALGRVTSIVYPDGSTQTKKYDPFGNIIQEIDAEGYSTEKTYNAFRQPLLITYPNGSQEYFSYNLTGTVASHTDKHGAVTSYTYDNFDHLIETIVGDKIITATWSTFQKLSEVEGDLVTHYNYDFSGRKIREQAAFQTTCYSYDAMGYLQLTCCGETYHIQEHDLCGRLIQKRVEHKGSLQQQESYAYDEAGNQTQVITSQGITETFFNTDGKPLSVRDPLGYTTHYAYLYDKNLTSVTTDPKGIQTMALHDSRGREAIRLKKNLQGEVIQYSESHYNKNGNLIQLTHSIFSESSSPKKVTHIWEYGPMGRLERFIESGEKETRYLYDNQGHLQTTIKPDGTKLQYEYDDRGRLLRHYAHDFDYRYTYDRRDRLRAVYDEIQSTETVREYNPLNNIIEEKLGHGLTLYHEYDNYNRKTKTILPDRSSIEYVHKGIYLHNVSRGPHTHTYSNRNLEGLITGMRLFNQAGEIHIERDALGRYRKLKSPYFEGDCAYDAIGNLTCYNYLNDLGHTNSHYTYDDLNQLIQEDDHSYQVDSLYNRLKKDRYAYAVNKLCQVTHYGAASYLYDRCGNLLFDGMTRYTYDSLDRLISVERGDQITKYTYDPFHRRLSKISCTNGNKTKVVLYLWDGNHEIGLVNEHNQVQELRILGEGLGADIGSAILYELGGKSYIPIHDHRGCVVAIVDPITKTALENYQYDAFGQEQTGHRFSPWRFSSKRIDEETGLVFFGRRYYSPNLGRFITQDPQGFEDGPNLYAYLHNNPMNDCDPYGLWSWKDTKAAFDNPRFQGAMQALGGLTEASIGGGMTLASSGWAAPLGWPILAHGLDQFTTGMHTAIFGNPRATATTHFLQKTGLSPEKAVFWDNMANCTLTFSGSMLAYKALRGSVGLLNSPSTSFPNALKNSFITQESKSFKPFIKSNCRYNLEQLTGISPSKNIHAHHVFPQKFKGHFIKNDINIHDPKYLTWWGSRSHLRAAKEYNADWESFFETTQGVTKVKVLEEGKRIMNLYGMKTHY